MAESDKITIEFTIKEVMTLCKALQNHQPAKEDEMLSFMLYSKIRQKIEEKR